MSSVERAASNGRLTIASGWLDVAVLNARFDLEGAAYVEECAVVLGVGGPFRSLETFWA